MSRVLCLNNIRLFLNACKSEQLFGLGEADLFDEQMLYDLSDLARVIRTLSIVSASSPCQAKGIRAFTFNSSTLNATMPANSSNQSVSNSIEDDVRLTSPSLNPAMKALDLNKSSGHSNEASDDDTASSSGHAATDDMFYDVLPKEEEPDPDCNYMDEKFLLDNESAYQAIVGTFSTKPTTRDYVMKEIISTEENFVAGLNTLMNDFLLPLSTVLNDQDRKTICINMSELIKLHSTLYEELKTACKGESSNSVFKICCK